MTNEELTSLLFEDESTTLDYKRKEYLVFDSQPGCSEETQAEFIKDMLAFANTTRRTSAVIVLGVTKPVGQSAEVIGITKQLDNAYVEQFLNGKLNRPITFTYSHITFEEKVLGIIEIPNGQKRPFHVLNDFGKIKRQNVYIRRNSSTTIASPDEIVYMGKQDSGHKNQPVISVNLWDSKTNTESDPTLNANFEFLEYPSQEEIPDYDGESNHASYISTLATLNLFQASRPNHSYYREKARYEQAISCATPINIVAKNTSGAVANDVRVVLNLSGRSWHVSLMKASGLPKKPEKITEPFSAVHLHHIDPFRKDRVPRIEITSNLNQAGQAWDVEFFLGKMQPGQSYLFEDSLFISAEEAGEHNLELKGTIFGDEIPQPVPVSFAINLSVKKRLVSVTELTNHVHGRPFRLPRKN